ncbi:uncharacterized protein LOC134779312 [Penaeus indicus]|uniref:uncharacterized protein LOC134779312 n=1 Tax=Penaeus indicus TaxID=29960 RepID=UPI00300C6A8B
MPTQRIQSCQQQQQRRRRRRRGREGTQAGPGRVRVAGDGQCGPRQPGSRWCSPAQRPSTSPAAPVSALAPSRTCWSRDTPTPRILCGPEPVQPSQVSLRVAVGGNLFCHMYVWRYFTKMVRGNCKPCWSRICRVRSSRTKMCWRASTRRARSSWGRWRTRMRR